MLSVILGALSTIISAKASVVAVSNLLDYFDIKFNEKGAFKCEVDLLGVTLHIDSRVDRQICQRFFDACRMGQAVGAVPYVRFLRIYLYSNMLLQGKDVCALPPEYFKNHSEFRALFLAETRRIWQLNQKDIYPFLNILKKNGSPRFIIPPADQLSD